MTNNTQNVNDISGVQDGYGLMISELLGNDMPNCSSVPPDVNSLHSEMGLNNGEVATEPFIHLLYASPFSCILIYLSI